MSKKPTIPCPLVLSIPQKNTESFFTWKSVTVFLMGSSATCAMGLKSLMKKYPPLAKSSMYPIATPGVHSLITGLVVCHPIAFQCMSA